MTPVALIQEMYRKFTAVQYSDVTFSLTMVAEFEHLRPPLLALTMCPHN